MELWQLNIIDLKKKNKKNIYIYNIMSDNSFAGMNFNNPESKNIFKTYSEMMCPDYKNENENSFIVNLNLIKNNDNSLLISGNVDLNSNSEKYYIKYTAANPPTYSSNYSGSGLPYPTEDIAFDNTPNRGVVEVKDGKFSFRLNYPNSYYINMGSVYIEPNVKLVLVDKNNTIIGDNKVLNLGNGVPFRRLSRNPKNTSCLFFKNNNLPVRTQYEILLDSAYPLINKEPNNFWGLMPPH